MNDHPTRQRTIRDSAAYSGPNRVCLRFSAVICAQLSDHFRLRPGTMTFLTSPAMWRVMMLALAASILIGVDWAQAGASLLWVATWFLLAPVLVMFLMFRGLEKVPVLVAVLHQMPPSDLTWKSCDLKRLHRPPRS